MSNETEIHADVTQISSQTLPKPARLYNPMVLHTLKMIHELLAVLSEHDMAWVMGVSSTEAQKNDLSMMTNLRRADVHLMLADMLRGSIEAGAREQGDA